MDSNAMATSAVMYMTQRDDVIIVCPDRKTGTGAAVMDFSGCFGMSQVATNNAAKRCNTG
jgi:hypothetical protein